jgi:hypothetical protein
METFGFSGLFQFKTLTIVVKFVLENMKNKLLTTSMDRQRLRPLVLHDEGIKHPFRQNLPAKITEIARQEHDSDAGSISKRKGLGENVSLFLLSFLAFFTVFYMFIF